MEGDGLRAEGETMDGREQTPSGMGSGVDLELYVDSDFASRDTNRRFVSGGVVMCAGACVSFFFLFSDAEKCHPFFYCGRVCCVGRGDQGDDFFFYCISGVLSSRTATLDAL